MIINLHDYRDKVLGCWMGKNIGAALGQPFEWKRKINDVTFYTGDITTSSLDLDIQLLWLRALEDNGVHIGTPILSEYYQSYITAYYGQYGLTKSNMAAGLMPPLSSMTSPSRHSSGAFVRSEIWACVSPGCPEIAAVKAYHDASIDHGAGEGLYAAIFMAVIQSAAFIQDDPMTLINIGLSYIPEDCGITQAVKCVIESHKNDMTWLEARDKVLEEHRGHYTTHDGAISQRDWDYDLADGEKGYDAPCNIGMIIIGWLYGEGDFARSICTTVNCGEDTDSNAGSLGALLGIIDGNDLIPKDWSNPIGRNITTKMIEIFDVKHIPKTIDELTARTERLAKIMLLTFRSDVDINSNKSTKVSQTELSQLQNTAMREKILRSQFGPIYDNGIITCALDYKSDGYIEPGGTAQVSLKLSCKLKHSLLLSIKWYVPKGFKIEPVANGLLRCPSGGQETEAHDFYIVAEGSVALTNRFVIEITSPGRHMVALIPVILLDGSLIDASPHERTE